VREASMTWSKTQEVSRYVVSIALAHASPQRRDTLIPYHAMIERENEYPYEKSEMGK
jgi:hypothetical protein